MLQISSLETENGHLKNKLTNIARRRKQEAALRGNGSAASALAGGGSWEKAFEAQQARLRGNEDTINALRTRLEESQRAAVKWRATADRLRADVAAGRQMQAAVTMALASYGGSVTPSKTGRHRADSTVRRERAAAKPNGHLGGTSRSEGSGSADGPVKLPAL